MTLDEIAIGNEYGGSTINKIKEKRTEQGQYVRIRKELTLASGMIMVAEVFLKKEEELMTAEEEAKIKEDEARRLEKEKETEEWIREPMRRASMTGAEPQAVKQRHVKRSSSDGKKKNMSKAKSSSKRRSSKNLEEKKSKAATEAIEHAQEEAKGLEGSISSLKFENNEGGESLDLLPSASASDDGGYHTGSHSHSNTSLKHGGGSSDSSLKHDGAGASDSSLKHYGTGTGASSDSSFKSDGGSHNSLKSDVGSHISFKHDVMMKADGALLSPSSLKHEKERDEDDSSLGDMLEEDDLDEQEVLQLKRTGSADSGSKNNDDSGSSFSNALNLWKHGDNSTSSITSIGAKSNPTIGSTNTMNMNIMSKPLVTGAVVVPSKEEEHRKPPIGRTRSGDPSSFSNVMSAWGERTKKSGNATPFTMPKSPNGKNSPVAAKSPAKSRFKVKIPEEAHHPPPHAPADDNNNNKAKTTTSAAADVAADEAPKSPLKSRSGHSPIKSRSGHSPIKPRSGHGSPFAVPKIIKTTPPFIKSVRRGSIKPSEAKAADRQQTEAAAAAEKQAITTITEEEARKEADEIAEKTRLEAGEKMKVAKREADWALKEAREIEKDEAEETDRLDALLVRLEAEKAAPPLRAPKPRSKMAAAAAADKKVRRPPEEKARLEAEKISKLEAEERQRQQAEEKARLEAAKISKLEAEERQKQQADEKARLEAEERERVAAERERKDAEERERKQIEEKVRLEAEEKAKNEEEKVRLEAEEKVKDEEEKARLEAEEKAKNEEEKARLEAEEKAKNEEEKARREETEAEKARVAAKNSARIKAEEEKNARLVTGFSSALGVWSAREEKSGKASPFSVKKDEVPSPRKPAKLRHVRGDKLDEESDESPSFMPPIFEKTKKEKRFIRKSMENLSMFEDLPEVELEPILDAFERVEYQEGETIAEQGGKEAFFYIVQNGEVSFHANGDQVAKGKKGDAFGALALVHPSARDSSVKAEHQTVVFRVESTNYRRIKRHNAIHSVDEKLKLLHNVPFFKNVSDSDLMQLSDAMVRHEFNAGDDLAKAFSKVPFCLVQTGKVFAADIQSQAAARSQALVGPGGSFGEESLVTKKPTLTNITAFTSGVAFTIDHESFEKVFGDIARLKNVCDDKKTLSGIKAIRTFKDSNLSEAELDSLVRQLSDETFEAGREVFTKDARTVPALYLVRKGRVKLVKKGGKEDIVSAGGYFGQDYFSVKSVGSRDAVSNKVKAQYSATTMEETVCSVLTVEECMAVFGIKIAAEDKVKPRYIPITDLTRHRILGEGLFGTVWLVTNKKARKLEPYALKIQMTEESHRPVMIKQEIKMMRALRYPFIVDVVATYEDENTISMLLSLAPGGELFDIIHRQDHEGEWVSGIGEGSAKFYAAVIADTIAFMHRQKFVFRDLKPENVLIDKDGYPVITDFGFTKKVEDKTFTFCGTPNYVAPEVITSEGHGAPADNWSFGVLLYELIDGGNPFFYEGMHEMYLYEAILREPYYPFPNDRKISDDGIDLVHRLLEKSPSQRLGSFREKDILEHPWFAKHDIAMLRSKQVKAPWIPAPVTTDD